MRKKSAEHNLRTAAVDKRVGRVNYCKETFQKRSIFWKLLQRSVRITNDPDPSISA
jgi:hypothetical protein